MYHHIVRQQLGRSVLKTAPVRASSLLQRQSLRAMSSEPKGLFEQLVAADQTLAQNKLYHKSNVAVMVLTPLAIVAHPSFLSMPVDIALSILFPLHAHMGMNWIFTDYVPGSPTGPSRIALFAATVLASLGLLKLSIAGNGVTGSLKALWQEPEKKKE